MSILPTDAKERKGLPLWTGVVEYFPLCWAEIAKASVAGNKQHVPGEPLHWDRSKSSDDKDAMFRHALQLEDPDENGVSHVGSMMWRCLAVGQKFLESRQKRSETNSEKEPPEIPDRKSSWVFKDGHEPYLSA